MSLLDILRQDFVKGRVVDKYRLGNGNLGLVINGQGDGRRYHVEFEDGRERPNFYNLYGLLKKPFSGKTDHVDKLVKEGDVIELSTSYSKGPFRQAYRIYNVSKPTPGSVSYLHRPALASGYRRALRY